MRLSDQGRAEELKMAVDTLPSVPQTAVVHQRTEAANRFREQRTQETTNRQTEDKRQDDKVVQARIQRNADDQKATTHVDIKT
jgi:hypothetical protein